MLMDGLTQNLRTSVDWRSPMAQVRHESKERRGVTFKTFKTISVKLGPPIEM